MTLSDVTFLHFDIILTICCTPYFIHVMEMSNSLPIEWEFFNYLYFLYNFSDYYGLISSQQSLGLYVARIHSDILNFVRRTHDIQFSNTFRFRKKIHTDNYHAHTLMTSYKFVRCSSNEKTNSKLYMYCC
jgi:hypothetical protein